jgi:uncharacterized OB-fold protein
MSVVPNFAPLDDPLTRPFWESTAQGGLVLPACAECGAWQWYPIGVVSCHPDAGLRWVPVSHEGSIFTFTRVERGFLPAGGEPPYTLVLVELDGVVGPRLVSVLTGAGCDAPTIGDRVRLRPTVFDTHTLPSFELCGDDDAAV